MEDFMGWVILVSSYLIALLPLSQKRDLRHILLLWSALTAYHVIAIANVYFVTVKGAGNDAQMFHEMAVEWAQTGSWKIVGNYYLYVELMGVLYRYLGHSKMIGSELSILAVLFSAFIFVRIYRAVNGDRHLLGALGAYLFMPSMMMTSSVTLREPYMVLFFMLAVYWTIRFLKARSKMAAFLTIVSIVAFSLLHKALMLYGLAMALYFSFLSIGFAGWGMKRLIVGGMMAALLISLGVGLARWGNAPMGFEVPQRILSGDIQYIEGLLEYKTALDSRATYPVRVEFSSAWKILTTTFLAVVFYLFAPFPWQVSTPIDLYGVFEGGMRFVLLGFALLSFFNRSGGYQQKIRKLLLLLYLGMALLWAVATTNYGTAIRHNLVHNWLLFVLGIPPFFAWFKKVIISPIITRHIRRTFIGEVVL